MHCVKVYEMFNKVIYLYFYFTVLILSFTCHTFNPPNIFGIQTLKQVIHNC